MMSALFEPAPDRWGLHGDPVLWHRPSDALTDVLLPSSIGDVRRTIQSAVVSATGNEQLSVALTGPPESRETADAVFVAELDGGGMAGGHVHVGRWVATGMPLLISRVESSLRPDR